MVGASVEGEIGAKKKAETFSFFSAYLRQRLSFLLLVL